MWGWEEHRSKRPLEEGMASIPFGSFRSPAAGRSPDLRTPDEGAETYSEGQRASEELRRLPKRPTVNPYQKEAR